MSAQHRQREVAARTNEVIDGLMFLARSIDPEYGEACADSACTNRPPERAREELVSLLANVALILNGSGLADSGEFEQFVPYLIDHGWGLPH